MDRKLGGGDPVGDGVGFLLDEEVAAGIWVDHVLFHVEGVGGEEEGM